MQAGAALAEAIAHLDLVEGGEVAERAHAEPDEQTGELFVSQHPHGERGEEVLRETCRHDGARGASSGGELCREGAVGDADAHLGEARLGEDVDEGLPRLSLAVVVARDAPCPHRRQSWTQQGGARGVLLDELQHRKEGSLVADGVVREHAQRRDVPLSDAASLAGTHAVLLADAVHATTVFACTSAVGG